MQGQIIKIISNDYTVKVEQKTYVCKARGKFRNMNITPLVGDYVNFDEKNKYILEIKDRKNYLVRPPICNIDQAIIITSTKHPNFDSNLLDKLLVNIEFNNVEPIICITKMDLLTEEEQKQIEKQIKYYQSIGYTVFKNDETKKIFDVLKNKITVFTGQSGSGKSTLLNKLDKTLNIKTDEISLALGRGKHTTRHTELLEINNGLVADTPGFSALSFNDMTNSDIRDNMIEFNQYRDQCRYKDCMHNLESDCAIKEKVEQGIILKSRYDNYLKFIKR